MTKVYFVRHAQPNYDNHNDALRELSPKGLSDRRAVNEFLANKQISIMLSSPYKRAVDTIKDFAEKHGLEIEIIDDFRERKVDSCWIENFDAFVKMQWNDFSYKRSDGESLGEVQDRNISALKAVLEKYRSENIVIGSHGTAISTIINYYDKSFGCSEFEKIKNAMPWIAEFTFDENSECIDIKQHRLI
ncbi:MAG: histidine phosphatase family protein [Oscillospiraceae bacterium]|nr:histidine phosphatase family protein [Oscillospiraceae bacterium]